MKWIIYELRIWNQVKLWSSQLWAQFLQLRREAWKFQDFNGVWTRDLPTTSSQRQWLHSSVGWSVAPESRGHGFKPRWSPEIFRLLYAIAKIALITAKIIASLGSYYYYHRQRGPTIDVIIHASPTPPRQGNFHDENLLRTTGKTPSKNYT